MKIDDFILNSSHKFCRGKNSSPLLSGVLWNVKHNRLCTYERDNSYSFFFLVHWVVTDQLSRCSRPLRLLTGWKRLGFILSVLFISFNFIISRKTDKTNFPPQWATADKLLKSPSSPAVNLPQRRVLAQRNLLWQYSDST